MGDCDKELFMSIELCSKCFGSGGEGRKCCGDTAENWGLFAVCGR